jgi:hypothetical protein
VVNLKIGKKGGAKKLTFQLARKIHFSSTQRQSFWLLFAFAANARVKKKGRRPAWGKQEEARPPETQARIM